MICYFAAASGLAFGQAANVKPIKISASQITKPINLGLGRGGGKFCIHGLARKPLCNLKFTILSQA